MPKHDKHLSVKPWLPEDDYKKALGQLRLKVGGVLSSTFKYYGMSDYVVGATNAVIELAEDFALRVRGADQPIATYYRSPWNGENVDNPDD